MIRILIEQPDTTRLIRLPLFLLATPLGQRLLSAASHRSDEGAAESTALVTLTQSRALARVLKRSRLALGGQPLLDFQSTDQTRVRVFL